MMMLMHDSKDPLLRRSAWGGWQVNNDLFNPATARRGQFVPTPPEPAPDQENTPVDEKPTPKPETLVRSTSRMWALKHRTLSYKHVSSRYLEPTAASISARDLRKCSSMQTERFVGSGATARKPLARTTSEKVTGSRFAWKKSGPSRSFNSSMRSFKQKYATVPEGDEEEPVPTEGRMSRMTRGAPTTPPHLELPLPSDPSSSDGGVFDSRPASPQSERTDSEPSHSARGFRNGPRAAQLASVSFKTLQPSALPETKSPRQLNFNNRNRSLQRRGSTKQSGAGAITSSLPDIDALLRGKGQPGMQQLSNGGRRGSLESLTRLTSRKDIDSSSALTLVQPGLASARPGGKAELPPLLRSLTTKSAPFRRPERFQLPA